MEVSGCLGKVLANGTRNFPLDTDRDTHPATIVGRNNNNGLSCQPASFSLSIVFHFLFLSQVKKGGGGPNEFLFYDDGPFSLCRFIASIKRTFKKNKNPAETHTHRGLAIYYSTTRRAGLEWIFESTLKEEEDDSCKGI